MQVQSSSHSVDTSHERSAGNNQFGKAPFQNDHGPLPRQVGASRGPGIAALRYGHHRLDPLLAQNVEAILPLAPSAVAHRPSSSGRSAARAGEKVLRLRIMTRPFLPSTVRYLTSIIGAGFVRA